MTTLRPLREFSKSAKSLCSFLGINDLGDGLEELNFTGITHNSKQVEPGDLFIALPGVKNHGADFVEEAKAKGVTLVLTDHQGMEMINDALPCLVVDNPRLVMGDVASWFYENPFASLDAVGITGTNGKTTTAALLDQIWRFNHRTTSLIGTIGTSIGDENLGAEFTTPEASDLQRLAAVMRERYVRNCVMEVSSHGIAQHRTSGIRFSVVGFTHLSQDHLDFHGDMESYFQVKAKLFSPEFADRGIVNIDSEHGRRIFEQSSIQMQTLSRSDKNAHWRYESIDRLENHNGYRVAIRGTGGILIEGSLSLIGLHNLDNALLAIALAVETQIDPLAIAAFMHLLQAPSGRLEPVAVGQKFLALVDYAHTPDAVKRVLATARELTSGRVIAVLGCGGDRDRSKRVLMGEALLSGSDYAVFTSDNPRSEDPQSIVDEMLRTDSILDEKAAVIEIDRRSAIVKAVAEAQDGDCVLVLGKGHEKGQEIAGIKYPFDDRIELARAIEGLS